MANLHLAKRNSANAGDLLKMALGGSGGPNCGTSLDRLMARLYKENMGREKLYIVKLGRRGSYRTSIAFLGIVALSLNNMNVT